MLDRNALYKGWWSYWTMIPSIKFCPMARIRMHLVHQKPLPGVIAPSVGYRPSSKVIRTEVTKMSGIYEYLSLVWVDLNYYRRIDSNLYKAATATAENTWMTCKYFLLFSKMSQGSSSTSFAAPRHNLTCAPCSWHRSETACTPSHTWTAAERAVGSSPLKGYTSLVLVN